AMGAGIQAALIAGDDVGAVLVDITPHSLGIRCLDYQHGIDFPFRFAPIIRRNTPLPASRSEMFSTVQDNQKEVEIEVYQGEHDDLEEEFTGMPELVPGPREGQREMVQARALLEKAERLLEKVAPEDKVELERMLNAVRMAVTDREWEKVTKACNELSDILFY